MTSLIVELRLAFRRFIGEPGFSVPAVATMAIGIGIATSVFALVEAVLIRPLPYPDSERLVSIRHVAPGIELARDRVSAGMFLHYRDGNRVFEGLGTYEVVSYTLTDDRGSERIRAAQVSAELFSVLQVTPQLGRLPAASDDNIDHDSSTGTTGALLGHSLWVRRYGADPGVIGRTIEVDGDPFVVVTGVAPEGFSFPAPETEAWLVHAHERAPWSRLAGVRQGMAVGAVGRLRAGVTLEDAEADVNRLVRALPEAFPDVTVEELNNLGLRARLIPFKDEVVGNVRLTLLLVLASGGFLLLVTWANVANLLLLRTHARRAEIGLARALGASERNVAARLLSESLVLTLAGGLLGLALAYVAIEARFGLASHQLPRLDGVGVNALVIGLVATLAVVSGIFMGIICLVSTRQRVAGPALSALRSRSATTGGERQMGRKILVAAQLALALTLLVGSGLMVRTFWELQEIDLGFRSEGVLTFYVPITHLGFPTGYQDVAWLHDQVLRRLREVPGVDAAEAATVSVFPFDTGRAWDDFQPIAPAEAVTATGSGSGAARTSRDDDWPLALPGYATPGYFQAMGIPVIAGRPFEDRDMSLEAPGVILSRSLAGELFADADPIGRSVKFVAFSEWASLTVVGVVGDVPGMTLREGGSGALYFPHVYPPLADDVRETLYAYAPFWETYVIRTTRDFASLVPELRDAAREIDPRLPILDVVPLDEVVSQATAQERITMRLLLVSAGAALFLGVVGIYAVLAYAVRRRTAEIGIRIALGASPRRVERLVVLQGAAVSAAGIVAGLAAALVLTRFIAASLYQTSPTDPLTFAGMTVLLFGVALMASYLPARRASRVDPARALRAE